MRYQSARAQWVSLLEAGRSLDLHEVIMNTPRTGVALLLAAGLACTTTSRAPAPVSHRAINARCILNAVKSHSVSPARYGAAVVADAANVYVAGGFSESGFLGRIDRLDTRTGEWSTLTHELAPRRYLTGVLHDGFIYVFGGYGPERTNLRTVERIDVETGTVEVMKAMPTGRYNASAAVLAGKIYVAGGSTLPDKTRHTTVEIYDPASDTWTAGPSLSEGRDAQLVAASDKLIALGGYRGDGKPVSQKVEWLGENGWTRLTDMPSPTSAYSTAAVGSRVVTFGDYHDLARVMLLEADEAKFEPVAVSRFTPRRHSAAATVGDRIFVVGGAVAASGSYLEEVEEFLLNCTDDGSGHPGR